MRDSIVVSQLKPRPVEWLWRHRIPKGAISVVAGRPDQGKGLFAALVAAEVTQEGGNVIYSAAEDDPTMMTRPRLEAAGAELDHVLSWRFVLPMQTKQLGEKIVANDAKLVVIDPFAAHLSGGVSRHSDNVRMVTQPMSELCEATGVTFLIVEHALKRVSRHAEPLAAIGGTGSGLPAAARAAFLFGQDPKDGDRRLLCAVKSNLQEKPKALAFETDVAELETVGHVPFLLIQEETEADAALLLATNRSEVPGRPPDKRAAAAEWLTRLLHTAGKPVKAGSVIEDGKQYGLTQRTIRRAADDMGVVRKPPGGGRSCTWELPAEVIKALDDAGAGKAGNNG